MIPDSTLPEIQRRIVDLASRLTAEPELVDSLEFNAPLRLSSEQASAVREGQAEIKAGLGLTPEQVRISLAEHKEALLAKNLG